MKNILKCNEICKNGHATLPGSIAIKNTTIIQRLEDWGPILRNATKEVGLLSISQIKCNSYIFFLFWMYVPTIKKYKNIFIFCFPIFRNEPALLTNIDLPIIMRYNHQMALFLILIVFTVL